MVGVNQQRPNRVQAPMTKVIGLQVKALWGLPMDVEMNEMEEMKEKKEGMEVVALATIDHHR
jgi:hypothetical protein